MLTICDTVKIIIIIMLVQTKIRIEKIRKKRIIENIYIQLLSNWDFLMLERFEYSVRRLFLFFVFMFIRVEKPFSHNYVVSNGSKIF